jgi:hypothetical protein
MSLRARNRAFSGNVLIELSLDSRTNHVPISLEMCFYPAWGRTGSDTKHDRNLGIFYQDDINKQRWILKSNDARTLSQIDAVFVTVEPNGESAKPSGKPLLFTYLRMTPNHP